MATLLQHFTNHKITPFLSLVFLCFAGTTLAPSHANAFDPPAETQHEAVIRGEYFDLFQDGKYKELDEKLGRLQKDYEQGKLNDVALQHISRRFYETDPTLSAQYDAWLLPNQTSQYHAIQMQLIHFSYRSLVPII